MFNPFKKEKPAKVEKKRPAAREIETAVKAPAKTIKEFRALGFSLVPHLTEKAMAGGAGQWYAFRLPVAVNKFAVKQAVEKRYGVKVIEVRTLSPRKRRVRRGRIEGQSPGFKKALVKVKKGQSIEYT